MLRRVLAVLALFVSSCAPAIPPVIADEIAHSGRGVVTVVSFTDFECPFCRRAHATLAPLVAARRGRVRVVLRHVPLPSHPDARGAARAAVCVERLTPMLLDDFADALYRSEDLSEAACERLATERGVDPTRYARCLTDAGTTERIERDIAMYEAVDGDGVPITYVDGTRVDGSASRAVFEAALDDALRRR